MQVTVPELCVVGGTYTYVYNNTNPCTSTNIPNKRMSAAAVERSPSSSGLARLPSSPENDAEAANMEEGEEVVPPSFYMLADDWNKHFVQAGDWLVSATESADSNPASDNEEEGADKAGFASGFGVNMAAMTGRASAASKNVGSFFSSAFSKAGASVKDASQKIRETVEKNIGDLDLKEAGDKTTDYLAQVTLLAEFNKEQEAFISAKGGKAGEAVAPWVGYPEEEALKEEILALSTDRRNFVRAPPTGVSFEFELEAFLPVAQATLEADPNLEKMRFELVPKVINEETFWRNYFYRVGLIRQSTELSSLERESSDTTSQTANEEDKGVTKGGGKDEEVEHPDSPSHGESEFVSDSFQPSSKDLEEVKKGISNLTKPSSGEEDWEKELREELGEDLGEYEVVTGGKDNEKWEEEIQSMIDDEDGDLR